MKSFKLNSTLNFSLNIHYTLHKCLSQSEYDHWVKARSLFIKTIWVMIALLFLRSDDDNEKIFKISYLIIFRNKWSVTFNEFQFLAWRSVTNVIVCLFDKNCNSECTRNKQKLWNALWFHSQMQLGGITCIYTGCLKPMRQCHTCIS